MREVGKIVSNTIFEMFRGKSLKPSQHTINDTAKQLFNYKKGEKGKAQEIMMHFLASSESLITHFCSKQSVSHL